MKKITVTLLLVCVVIGIWLYLNKGSQPPTSPMAATKETNQPLSQLPESNSMVVIPSSRNLTSAPSITEPTNEMANALTVTNLEQWKAMIKGLKYSDNFGRWDSWVMEQTNRLEGIPVLFEENGQAVSYKVRFIDVDIYSDSGKIMEVKMHSPIMNIDETRELGLQLCSMLQVDPKGFLAWCDKVGNQWLDAPVYADGNRNYSFHLLRSYDNEKPWYINFMITPNP
jgi:hypothetical protein